MEKNKQSIFVSPNKIELVNPNVFSFIRNVNDIRKHKQNTTIQELLQFKNIQNNKIADEAKLNNNNYFKSYNGNDVKVKYEHFDTTSVKQNNKIYNPSKTKRNNNNSTISTPLNSKVNNNDSKISVSSTNSNNNNKTKVSTIRFSTPNHHRKTIIDLEKELLEKQSELRNLEIKALNNKLVVQSVVTHIDKSHKNYEKEVQRLVNMINRAKSDLKLQYITAQSI